MINEEATFEEFGYHSCDLTLKSGKNIIAVCDDCGKVRTIPKGSYHASCKSCVKNGEKNPSWKGGKVKVECDNCGKIIELEGGQSKSLQASFLR